jgi:hypothetical protein
MIESSCFKGVTVENANPSQHVRNLAAVGTDVLHWRRTDGARNARETLDARGIAANRLGDNVIPGFAGLRFEHERLVVHGDVETAGLHAQDQAWESIIRDDQIRSAAEDEDVEPARARPAQGMRDVIVTDSIGEIACTSTQPQRGQRGERNEFLKHECHEANRLHRLGRAFLRKQPAHDLGVAVGLRPDVVSTARGFRVARVAARGL